MFFKYPNPPNKPEEASPKKMQEEILGEKKYKTTSKNVSARLIKQEKRCADRFLLEFRGWLGCTTGAIKVAIRHTSVENTTIIGRFL